MSSWSGNDEMDEGLTADDDVRPEEAEDAATTVVETMGTNAD